jgi:pyridoxamine-phosphate oxidase
MEIHAIRKDYTKFGLDIENAFPDAIHQFEHWFSQALEAQVLEPNAMVLATVDKNHKPHARVVLLKDVSKNGFSFFTNYDSSKGSQLAVNEYATLVFFWAELERQVRIEGKVSKLSIEESEKYFHSRPRASQIGAHVSPQSTVIESRSFLEEKQHKLTQQFENQEIPLPSNWGGYVLKPNLLEFWQGRPSRLHDRLLYTEVEEKWKIERLAP